MGYRICFYAGCYVIFSNSVDEQNKTGIQANYSVYLYDSFFIYLPEQIYQATIGDINYPAVRFEYCEQDL